MKNTTQSLNGTSFHDIVIEATVKELKQILGEPEYDSNDGQDKVNFEWVMETDSGDVFTVYDYKEYRPLYETEMIKWHIGGQDKAITEQAKREIKSVRVTG